MARQLYKMKGVLYNLGIIKKDSLQRLSFLLVSVPSKTYQHFAHGLRVPIDFVIANTVDPIRLYPESVILSRINVRLD